MISSMRLTSSASEILAVLIVARQQKVLFGRSITSQPGFMEQVVGR